MVIKIILSISLFILSNEFSFCQRVITRNGVKINKIDKQDKKQGNWFFFDSKGDISVSCYYKDDSIITPIIFYKNSDTAFIRLPKTNGINAFLIYENGRKILGNYIKISKDSFEIELVGNYVIKQNNVEIDNIDVYPDSLIEIASNWLRFYSNPIYTFGKESMKTYLWRKFYSSPAIFNKNIAAKIFINSSGIVEKVEFPNDKNNLSIDEERELSYIFSQMERWQPCFKEDNACSFNFIYNTKSKISYMW